MGIHHQNAIAKSRIKEVCYGGRVLFLHATHKLPETTTTNLWSYGTQSILDRHNKLSLDDKVKILIEKTPVFKIFRYLQIFTLRDVLFFFIVEANQSGKIGPPKWEPRTHTGIYLGHSPCHAGSVFLVLNLKPGLVSPQFHVVYEGIFTTVPYLISDEEQHNWKNLLEHSTKQSFR